MGADLSMAGQDRIVMYDKLTVFSHESAYDPVLLRCVENPGVCCVTDHTHRHE